ncbi:hypothetical protein ACJMK2_012669 [Sinanodonta woodiana]|uniref:BEN domain-containing protein n=1 Tax=Sinanodonta woodiana TaxID=1069815 RepID=A0ABD3VBB4_SINWO
MVELVNGTNVYVHLDEYRTAISKSVPKLYKRLDNSQEIHKDGKRIARYLMSIFFEKKELQERSLTNSELSRYPPLNQKIVNAILAFSVMNSDSSRADVKKAMRTSLTSKRCKARKQIFTAA